MTRNNYIICHCTTKWGLHHKVTNFGFPYFFQTLHLETMLKRTKIIYHNALQELSRKNSNEDGELWEPLPPWVETKCFTTSKLFENFDLSKLKILTDEASVSEIIIDNVVPTLSGDVEQPQCNQSDLLPRISPKPISEISVRTPYLLVPLLVTTVSKTPNITSLTAIILLLKTKRTEKMKEVSTIRRFST